MANLRLVLLVITLVVAASAAAVDTSSPRELEVSFSHPGDGVVLHGTLTLPPGDGPFPVVVMIHGSGPQNRDETSSGSLLFYHSKRAIPLFAEIAETLADAGVASLRYDKRTCVAGNSGGKCRGKSFDWDVDATTLDLFAEDAMAAVAWVRERPEIRPDALVVLGHSQGAVLAPDVAQKEAGVVGVVLLGCPAAEDPVLDHPAQQERLLRYHGSLEKKNDTTIERLRATVASDAELATTVVAGSRTEPYDGISVVFWTSWFARKVAFREQLQNLDVPVAAYTGGFDRNLPPQPHLDNIRAWRGPREGDLFAEVPRASHALVGLDPKTFSVTVHQGFLRSLAAWVVATADGGAAPSGSIAPWEDPVSPALEALLCRAAGQECDIDGIRARMSGEMKGAISAEEMVGIVDEDVPGQLATVENLRIEIHENEVGDTWCQEDLLTDVEGNSSVLLTCWQKGPELVGVFLK
jgi:pimeloyl-ACP methyl ester carboxylesterase